MPLARGRTDLPVLLLHNIDQAWDPADIDLTLQEVANLESALEEQGHPVTNVPVFNADLSSCLSPYDPDRHIVFNWCEEIPGVAAQRSARCGNARGVRFHIHGLDVRSAAFLLG